MPINRSAHNPIALVITATLLALATFAAGCAPYARVNLTAIEGEARLNPSYRTAAFRFVDENTVDIYLSDLSISELDTPWLDPASNTLTRPDGQITHIHMFLRPRPGRTPIDPNASNATIRHLILAPDNATGLYAGGGFLLPASDPDAEIFKGTIKSGSLTLDAASDTFTDALGATRFRASLKVRQNDDLARTIALRLAETARTIR